MQPIMRRTLKTAGFGFFLVLTTTIAGLGQTAEKANTKPQVPWIVTCSNAQSGTLSCQITQTLLVAQTRQRILGAVLFGRAQDSKLIMRLTVPHGVYLPDGVALSIDKQAAGKFAIEYADQNGGYVNVPVDDALLRRMKRGNKMMVSFKTRQKENLRLELSLDRFTASFDSMRSVTVSKP